MCLIHLGNRPLMQTVRSKERTCARNSPQASSSPTTLSFSTTPLPLVDQAVRAPSPPDDSVLTPSTLPVLVDLPLTSTSLSPRLPPTPAQPEYAADVILVHRSAAHAVSATQLCRARAPFLLVSSSLTPSLLNIEPRLLLAAMPAASNLAKNLWPSFSRPRPALPTPPTLETPLTPCLSRSVTQPLPSSTSPLHELTPPRPLSPAIASPCLSEIKVNSHRAQEQEDSSKIEKYDTAPITKRPQAQDRRDTSDNSNNSLLSLIPQAPDNLDSDDDDSDDDSDDDYVVCDLASKSDLSDQNRAFDQSGDTFNGDIEDASAHGDDENAGSSGDSCTVYDPGGISTSSVFSDTTQASTTSDDITDNSSPLSTHAPFPLNHDAADRINTRSDTNGLGNAASFGLGISSSDDRNIAYDPGGDIHNNHGHTHAYDPGGNYFDNDFSPTPRTLLSAMTPASSAAATAHTTPAASATSATASSFTIQAATTLPTTS